MSRVAEKLFVTQPAISLQIKSLQEELGYALFNRTPRGMVLTENGQALMVWAQKVLAAHLEFQYAGQRLKNAERREQIKIGTILDPEFIRLGLFLKELLEKAPHIETSLQHSISGEVLQRIEHESLDVGFYLGDIEQHKTSRNETLFEVHQLTTFTYKVIAPAGWGPRIKGQDWQGLASLPWILTPPASVHSRLLSKIFNEIGVQPKRVAQVDQENVMLDLVKSGIGLSLARDTIALHESRVRGIVVSDTVSVPCTLSFVYLKSRMNEPVIEYVRAALNTIWS